ncbi:putative rna polymerase ii mediator complex component med8 protein [Eutypa lata UCREL1]|uniref:Mediator of RNA polymerase II transcription subunit 8 n=1 Tax=Eutypa lata (strain UCR-EL1) TaxID=1287681 RepID=M7T511_EUTLA|nr:putative rna polymerase ii mediator complex component med8 protein [Eutypa lata UCREL1]
MHPFLSITFAGVTCRESLQASADILQQNLRSLLDILAQHNDLFNRVAVHPSTNFPGRTQEHILVQLLRKKPEPDVAAAMDEGRETLAKLVSSSLPPTTNTTTTTGQDQNRNRTSTNNNNKEPPSAEMTAEQQRKQTAELEKTWKAAREFCRARIVQYAQEEDDDPYTEEERDVIGIANVRTGLRKPQWDPFVEENEEDEDNDVMVVDRPPPPPAPAVAAPEVEGSSLENIMRFSARGEFMPSL